MGCAWGFGDLDKQATEMGVEKVGLGHVAGLQAGRKDAQLHAAMGLACELVQQEPGANVESLGDFVNLENAKRWQVETSQYTGVVADWVDEMHEADPRLKLSHEQLSNSHIGLISVKYDGVVQPIVEAAQAIMYQNAPIQATLDAAATKVDAILKA